MKIAISAESTIDITEEIKKENDIKIVPFQIFLGDENKLDGEITSKENRSAEKQACVAALQCSEYYAVIVGNAVGRR